MNQIYKYPVLFVTTKENDEKCLYKYEHVVSGIDMLAPLGYYDEAKTSMVTINTDKNVFNYNWAEVIQRISRNDTGYLDRFESVKNVIIVHDDVTYNRPAEIQNYTAVDMTTGERIEKERWVQFVNSDMYTSTIKEENTLKIEKTEKAKKAEEKNHKKFLKLNNNEETPHVQFPEAVEQLEKNRPSWKKILFKTENLIPLSIIILFIVVGYNGIKNISNENEIKTFKENMVVTTSTVATSVIDTNQAEIETNQLTALNAVVTAGDTTGVVMTDEQRTYIDSILTAKDKADSVDVYLRSTKKVSITLTAEIEDGVTTRAVNATAVVDSIREKELSILTNTINSMANKMAEERRADYDSLAKRSPRILDLNPELSRR